MLLQSAALVTQPVAIFFIVLVIILCTPLLFNKLKIPHVIGMILAGVAVGPHGFNILADDSSFAIFGQVGLLYLMFLAGLEIDMYHLRLNLKRGLAFGLLTLIIPLALGIVTSVWLLHLDWLTSMLLGAMYASHTLIAYPVATRLGITRSPAVLIAIVGTIIAVIGALLVLAATVGVCKEGAFDPSIIIRLLAWMAVYCAAVLFIFPRLTRFFFKHVTDKVTQYVYILAMVFLAAIGAQAIGLEAVLGAFFAGLVLNRYVPGGSPLMSSIEFVGNALFIPYFLISVGMMIDVKVVFVGSTLAIAGIMLAVALSSKWLPAFLAQKINGLSGASRNVLFGLTSAHTAVALAVVTLGYNLHLLNEQVLNSTVLVILITCAVAPMFTAGAAAKLKVEMMESEDGAGDNLLRRTRHNHTLISVSSPSLAQELVDLAVLTRNDRGTHDFYALHVRSDNSNKAKALSRDTLEIARKAAAGADIPLQTLDRYDINISTGVVNAINERDITEVVVGMHRRTTVIDSFFGNSISQLLRSTNKMVLISRLFIPANTITRIVVWAPPKARYETGFSRWVRTLSRLTRQLGCRIIFCCTEEAQLLIRSVIYHENYGIRCEFQTVEQWDDFVLMSNKILDDDLFVVIGARVNSVSYSKEMVELPQFLQKYFSGNNLLLVYPEQFGEEVTNYTSFADPLSADIASAPSPLWLKLRGVWRKGISFKKRITHRNRRQKIEVAPVDDHASVSSLLSVVIPVYNRAELILATLQSIENQTLLPKCLILVDNNSTDNSLQAMQTWADAYSGPMEVKIVSEHKQGASAARNKGLQLVDTEWTMFFDSDDLMLPNHIEQAVALVKSRRGCKIVGWPITQEEIDGTLSVKPFEAQDAIFHCVMHGTMATLRYMAKTELFRRAGGWNECVSIWDDIELGSRMLQLVSEREIVKAKPNKPTVHVRVQEASITGTSFSSGAEKMVLATDFIEQNLPNSLRWIPRLKLAVLSGLCMREGDEGKSALVMKQALSNQRNIVKRLCFKGARAYTARGFRGAGRLLRPLFWFN